MSAPGPSDARENVDRRKSLGKYVKRMSSVFKRDKPPTGSPSSTPAAATPAAPSTPAPVAEPKKEEEPKGKEQSAEEKPKAAAAAPAAHDTAKPAPTTSAAPQTKEMNRAALQQERARALFAKYGLTLESHEWISATAQPVSVQRVEKPIRMRVHRSCHHCGTSYGANKVCTKCDHKRCKKCPRYPQYRSPAEKAKLQQEKEAKEAAEARKKKGLLIVTNKAGDERVYRHVKQRVRRSCHQCQTYFVPATATVCENCKHVRCTKCPRDPAKLSKWPHGYPGDAEAESETDVERPPIEARRIWRKPRTRVRWQCEECNSHFIEGVYRCPGCGHERCDKCTRKPLKKAKKEPQFDPELVAAVEAKLRAFAVADQPPASSAEAT